MADILGYGSYLSTVNTRSNSLGHFYNECHVDLGRGGVGPNPWNKAESAEQTIRITTSPIMVNMVYYSL